MAVRNIRFLLVRRIVQVSILAAFAAGNYLGVTHLIRGNLSSSMFFDKIPMSDPFAVVQIYLSGHTLQSTVLIGALLVAAFYALFFGRAFCSWVCPINIITDIAAWLNRRFGFRHLLKIPEKTRFVILILSLVLSFVLGVAAFEWVSPIGVVQRMLILGVTGGWMVIFSIFLFDLFILKHGFCGHLCPLGAFYALIGKQSVLGIQFKADQCTDCMKCHKICPEPLVLKDMLEQKVSYPGVTDSRCTQCGRCIDVCDDDALLFKPGFKWQNQTKQ